METNENIKKKLDTYTLDQYIKDVINDGLEVTWNNICNYVIGYGEKNEFLKVHNFGEMYEIGLAIVDKHSKKESGQYYTPDDIALVMGRWLKKVEGYNVCDVACGTGKLILTYLKIIGKKEAIKLISEGRIYLYDFDKVALKICKTSIMIKYGVEYENKIHAICADFLDKNIRLPENSKVISNPPYAEIAQVNDNWNKTDVLKETKELYSTFMEKIFMQAQSTVIITPFSFISGNKFKSLRKEMCNLGNGFIVSFDNVPGNIFCGRKHGVFNTNTANSVRAAVTVLRRDTNKKGFRVSPLIRFKNEERNKLLINKVLESTLPKQYQIIDENHREFEKLNKELIDVYKNWIKKSKYQLKDLTIKDTTKYLINIPNTCRYYTTASHRKLNRKGSITINIDNEDTFCFIYCLMNSSFAYWWWRIYDGGITYPLGLINEMPVPINLLTIEDKEFFAGICNEMKKNESKYIITKVNAGVKQENIKFPKEYRDKINDRILKILGCKEDSEIFNEIHSNVFFMKEVDNMNDTISITNLQKELMQKFYAIKPTKVIFNKKDRNLLWKKATSRERSLDFTLLDKYCPALSHQIKKSYENGKNIQAAVFSECVYSQTIANMLNLNIFTNCIDNTDFIPEHIKELLEKHNLIPRYSYSNNEKTQILIQAGSCKGIDSVLINVNNLDMYTIEFKEPGAKTSEPDLPKYKEDGVLLVTDKFLKKYPQFSDMLDEQKGLNFFEAMGSNIKNFSKDSVNIAVSNNYTKKYADVICTEDINGYFVMIPVDQVSLWAEIEGEIRPAGRNPYSVWTPNALKKFLIEKQAIINNTKVEIKKEKISVRNERGGNGKVSGYKINPLFFVHINDCKDNGNTIIFDMNKVKQLNPTIAGKMFFKKLKYSNVKKYYGM